MDRMIAETAERIFANHAGRTSGLWHALEDVGLTRAWVPETAGGAGLDAADGFGLMSLAAAHGAAVPLAETLLASWAASAAGLVVPAGPGTLAAGLDLTNGQLTGKLKDIAFGAEVNWIAILASSQQAPKLALIDASQINRLPPNEGKGGAGAGLGGDPVTDISIDRIAPLAMASAPSWLTADTMSAMAALARAAQMAGAAEACLELTLTYANGREQFGRALSKFQAIQHLLSDMACEVAAMSAAVDGAVETAALHRAPDLTAVAAAKIRTGEGAGRVAASAHQVHGAMGYTYEYALSALTRRLWQWREAEGDETAWAIRLGHMLSHPDAPSLRDSILGGSTHV